MDVAAGEMISWLISGQSSLLSTVRRDDSARFLKWGAGRPEY